ncbi:hypothetical protein [Synechococcus lacustris]|uniref:Lipopolysaccharide biosynthesis protein n=1 Tax=Synechococcus lacustris str. Tous TaxID=1910958 RepID=A0A2P7EBG4_9SYNE|nr:hypothetical protein [Synechococcus lacustris]PSI00567.1 hypothetical protein C7K08_12480 [Synechococcus lacustris str. Tous]
MIRFEGKRLLFVAPPFFGYYNEIIKEIQSRGGIVDWLPDRPLDHPIGKLITRFAPKLVSHVADRIYFDLLSDYGVSSYDYVLVINGQTLSAKFLRSLRASFPGASFILYMWDSVANRRHISDNFAFFDRILSFDPADAVFYGYCLRPLFYTPQFSLSYSHTSFAYDLSFVGTAHSDRYDVISRLTHQLPPAICAFWYLYLQAPWVFYVYRLLKSGMRHSKLDEFRFEPLSMSSVNDIFISSRAVLDINHPRQHGLTMRTFETLGASKKLVTTNANISEYDFYDPANIAVIDRRSPSIPAGFLRSAYSPVAPSIVSRYSLAGWLDEVFGV